MTVRQSIRGNRGAVSVGRIICERCGRDLGPTQPLPHTLAFCRHCGIWIDNEGKTQPRHISGVVAKVMGDIKAKRKAKRRVAA